MRPLLVGAALALLLVLLIRALRPLWRGSVGDPRPDPPPYAAETFLVPPRDEGVFAFDWLKAGSVVEGYCVVTGGRNDVSFRVRTPSGGYLAHVRRVIGRHDFYFEALEAGPYVFVLDNRFSLLTGKQITLVYRTFEAKGQRTT